jgi:hypothetical protein
MATSKGLSLGKTVAENGCEENSLISAMGFLAKVQ